MFHVKLLPEPNPPPAWDVSRETTQRLHILSELIQRWSGTVNLVSKGDLPLLWQRHIADSLQLVPLLPPAGRCIDLGSGGGFPGLVLAIAAERHFHLIEADQRKAAFLREAARACGAAVDIHPQRAETLTLPPASLVTARALAPLSQSIYYAAPLLAHAGICLLLKGKSHARELAKAMELWQFDVQQWRSATSPDGVILQISHLVRRG